MCIHIYTYRYVYRDIYTYRCVYMSWRDKCHSKYSQDAGVTNPSSCGVRGCRIVLCTLHTHIHIHIHIHAFIYTPQDRFTRFAHAYTCTYTHICIHIYAAGFMHVVHTYADTWQDRFTLHTHIHIHIYVHIHIYAYVYTQKDRFTQFAHTYTHIYICLYNDVTYV